MAETTEATKVYCMPSENSSLNPMLSALLTNQNQHDPMLSAMVANGNQNQMFNNPWAYIMMMWLFRMMGPNFGAGAADNQAENYNSRAIAQLQDTVNNNASTQTIMDALSNNQSAIRELAQTFNTDINTIQQACCGINASIKEVGGQVGFSAESVKNAIALGDSNIVSKMQECCCANKLLVTEQGYQNQLATERQTGIITSQMSAQHSADMLQDANNQAALLSRIDSLANGITQGFAQIGYATQQQTNEIVQAGNANTQRILDQMCQNTTQSLRDQLADRDRQLQTQTLLNQLGNGCNCNS